LAVDIFEGHLSGGERAQTLHVTVALDESGLSIKNSGGEQIAFWQFSDLKTAAPIDRKSNDVLLRHALTPSATLFMKGAGAGRELLARA
jgi:hypothetical protein